MTTIPFSHLSQDELDRQHSPSLTVKDAKGVLDRHVGMTEAVKTSPRADVVRDLAYGTRPAERLDWWCQTDSNQSQFGPKHWNLC
jgi:hypothetical protein